jgi:hypothetical protein
MFQLPVLINVIRLSVNIYILHAVDLNRATLCFFMFFVVV